MVDSNTKTVTVNDKQFLISGIDGHIIVINNKELYNSLVNANMPIFIKTIGGVFQIAGYATSIVDETAIQLSLRITDAMFIIVVNNQ